MAKQLTIRGVSDEVALKLDQMSSSTGRSVNSLVKELLSDAVSENARRRRLERYATWTAQDEAEFNQALADQRKIEEDMWRWPQPRPWCSTHPRTRSCAQVSAR